MKSAFFSLRDHARERGIDFTLPFAVFEVFAKKTDYLNRKGQEGHCLTVDRIDNLVGYVEGNIQPMSREENIRKRFRRDEIRAKKGYAWAQ